MSEYALLNNVEHKDLRVIVDRSAEFGDAVRSCAVFPFEFRNLQICYPILLQQLGDEGMHPVALLGFEDGENLFLGERGWNASYIPAMMAKEPFLIGMQDGGRGDRVRMLSIDMKHPRVSDSRGEPLFQPLGGRTPYLERVANLLETIYQGHEHSKLFIDALRRYNLSETINFEITLKDGTRNQLIGYHGIAEEQLKSLDGQAMEELSRGGFLMPIFMMLASLGQMGRLIDLKNEQLQ